MFAAHNFFSDPSWNDLWGEFVWDALKRLDEFLLQQKFSIEIEIPDSVHLERPELISIGKNTLIEPEVLIQGPCILGENCIVRHGALLRGGVLCGNRCVIGHASEVKHSILLDGSQAAHLNYVGDSILGKNVNLGAGVKCANLRFDRREVVVNRIKTGLMKFGSIIGDGCQIGCNAVLNPGTLVGPGCFSYPLLQLHGIIPSKMRIRGSGDELQIAPLEVAILDSLR
jgi:NDP-sugar pyrophosphorylase family protein